MSSASALRPTFAYNYYRMADGDQQNVFRLLLLQCPITALRVCSSCIVGAQGPRVVLIDTKNGEITHVENVIPGQTIHGLAQIFLSETVSYLFVWGGRYGRIIVVKTTASVGKSTLETQKGLYSSEDWISHAATFSNRSSGNDHKVLDRIALVTGHNALVLLSVQFVEDDQIAFTHVQLCEASRTLLYCAHISWITERHILVTSGTALGQIIVRSCLLDNRHLKPSPQAANVITLYSFDAHDGSVFSLDTVFFASKEGKTSKLVLCSCSDDRTIRVWDITPRFAITQQKSEQISEHATEQLLQTPVEVTRSPQLLGKTWAHNSRIWDVKSFHYSKNLIGNRTCWKLLSFGEDASVQSWHMELCEPGGVSIRHLERFETHSGKSIWSHTISRFDKDAWIVATGGADGAIILTELDQRIEKESLLRSISDTPHRPLNDLFEAGDKVKTYSFFHCDMLIATTHRGKVLIASIRMEASHSPIGVYKDLGIYDELDGYSLTAGLPEIGAGFVASSRGDVYCYHPNGVFNKILNGEPKITGLYTHAPDYQRIKSKVKGQPAYESRNYYLLVASLGGSEMVVLEFEASDGTLAERQTVSLQVPHGALATSFSVFLDGPQLCFLLGFRNGLLSIYRAPESFAMSGLREDPIVPSSTHHCHKDAVTIILPRYAHDSAKVVNVLTTGRDSHFSIHEVSLERELCLHTIHRATIPLGPFIEGAYIREEDQHLLFYGFKSTDFVIYDETEKQVVSSVDCGGAHRVWAYHRGGTEGSISTSGTFVWTRSGQMHSLFLPKVKSHILQRGGHGREIKSCASSKFDYDICTGSGSGLVATAAEDTNIRLYECRSSGAAVNVECVNIIRRHNTGVQHLAFDAGGSYLFSCGSSEEFFVWKLRRAPFISLGIICESVLPPISELPELRIMDFKVCTATDDPDSTSEDTVFQITMVFSDSTIRTYSYSNEKQFELLAVGSYGTSCLAQLGEIRLGRNITLEAKRNLSRGNFVTGGTDGHIMLWHTHLGLQYDNLASDSRSFEVFERYKIHQNTIKCMIVVPLRTEGDYLRYAIFTGGDDNAVAVTRLDQQVSETEYTANPSKGIPADKYSDDGYLLSRSTVLISRAHAASVSAMQIGEEKIEGLVHEWTLVSVGNDQRMKIWRVSVDVSKSGADSIQIQRLANEYTSVADVADICVLPVNEAKEHRSAIVICGVGMEIRGV